MSEDADFITAPATFRAKLLLRAAAWAGMVLFVACAAVIAILEADAPSEMSLERWVELVVLVLIIACLFLSFLRLQTERVAVAEDGIEHSVLWRSILIRYADVVSVRRRKLRVAGDRNLTAIGDAHGNRIALGEHIANYEEIARYVDSKIGDRHLARCPLTAYERMNRGVMVLVPLLWLLYVLYFWVLKK
jgi:hypothetical protein